MIDTNLRPIVVLVLAALLPASAAFAASECRRECQQARRSCTGSSKDIFRSARADCGSAESKAERRDCQRQAKTTFQGWKGSCRNAFRSCQDCCRSGAGAACTGGGGGGGGGGGAASDTSAICPEARGALAVHWDWLNGVFHPLARVPTPGSFWTPYQHPGYPLLGFLYPPGWTPETLAAEQTVGVNLYRNDGRAIWRYLGTWGDTSAGPRLPRDFEVNAALAFLGNPAPVRTVCLNEGQTSPAPGIVQAGSNAAVEAGPFTIFVSAATTTLEGLAGGQIIVNTAITPTAEIDDLVFNVFLPIHFQFFVGRSVGDRDGDGVPDGQDGAPDDPARS